MPINWESVWNNALNSKLLFPYEKNKKSISVSCPTRFSNTGKFSIDITPSFREDSISLELLTFNDNVSLSELDNNKIELSNFNSISDSLVNWEVSNKLLDRFEISSDGFTDEAEATKSLIDYINNKATESGRMFDDKLDELNDALEATKSESYKNYRATIKESRRLILSKVGCILKSHYNWHASKNENFDDSVASFFDANNNLVAVVSLVEDNLLIDLAKDITAKVSVLQSDEDIEEEIVDDVDNAEEILADRELSQLKDAVATDDSNEEYYYSLLNRVVKLENKLINYRLKHKC